MNDFDHDFRYVEGNVIDKYNLRNGDILPDHSIKVDKSSELRFAVEKNHFQDVKELCKKSINHDNLLYETRNSIGQNALHIASKYLHKEIMLQLLIHLDSLQMNSDTQDNDGRIWSSLAKEKQYLLNSSQEIRADQLHNFAENNCFTDMLDLMISGIDVNSKNLAQKTCLHIAAEKGYHDMVRFLINIKADVNSKNNLDETPLHLASKKGRLEVVMTLLKKNANVNDHNHKLQTALHYASNENHLDVVDHLIQNEAKICVKDENDQSPLCYAVIKNHFLVAKKLLETRSFYHSCRLKDGTSKCVLENNCVPLQTSVSKGNIEMTKLLLENEAEVNLPDDKGSSALHFAAIHGQTEVAKILLEYEADVHATDLDQKTPLHIAALCGHSKMIDLLIENGAKVEVMSCNGNTPLQLCAKNGNEEALVSLLKHDEVDKDSQKTRQHATIARSTSDTPYGSTPLHYAAHRGHLKVAVGLLMTEANIEARNEDGMTPLHLSSKNGHVQVTEFLLSHCADPNARDQFKKTPLHYVSNHEIAKLLLCKGARVDALDYKFLTSLHHCAINGYSDVAEVLLNHKAQINFANETTKMTALHFSAKYGQATVAEVLIANQEIELNPEDCNQNTPLHLSAYYGNIEVTKILLNEPGIKLNKRNDGTYNFDHSDHKVEKQHSGLTPLKVAKMQNHAKIVDLLKNFGGQVVQQPARQFSVEPAFSNRCAYYFK